MAWGGKEAVYPTAKARTKVSPMCPRRTFATAGLLLCLLLPTHGLAQSDGYKWTIPWYDGWCWDISRIESILKKTHMDESLAPAVQVQFLGSHVTDSAPRVEVHLKPSSIAELKRRLKHTVRTTVIEHGTDQVNAQFGLVFDDDWEQTREDANLVVLLHGFNSRPSVAQSLIAGARRKGFPCAVLVYPNDQPIVESARLLAQQLRRFAQTHPHRRVTLVAYSMGGLVARAAIEDPEIAPGNVQHLIMVAPPNHGTSLARWAIGIDLFEYATSKQRRQRTSPFYAAVEDGLAEAVVDLKPNSRFLQQLNARPRNENIRYTIVLGKCGLLRKEDIAYLRKQIESASRQIRGLREWKSGMLTMLEEYDELIQGKGDGVVSLRRGRLDGVHDTVELNFSHTGVLHGADPIVKQRVEKLILDRLGA